LAGVAWGSPVGRGIIAAATLGSGLTLLDGTVVNVALRSIGEDLDASLAQLQWVVNGYFLSLASLILLGGALGDRFGRRRIFVVGTVWFALASLACGLAPNAEVLIGARVLQGVGGALLTPGSLALLQSAFRQEDRGRAIGAWSGLGGIATAAGPLVGGLLIDYVSWRWVFLINLPLAVLTVWLAQRFVPESRSPAATGCFDALGAALATVALATLTFVLTDWHHPWAVWSLGIAVAAGVGFVVTERRTRGPMVPLGLFADRTFSAANAMTALVYAALGAILFFLVLQLQTVGGYTALQAGLATLPITVCMLLFAARAGELGARIGPRIPMSVGPVVMAAGTVWLVVVDADVVWWRDVLPGLTVFGLGLALMVAPLTATVLAAAPDEHTGIASGINNAVARAGSLLAVAALPVAVGLTGDDYRIPGVFDHAYGLAMLACAGLLVLGGLVSWVAIPAGRNTPLVEV
jgi:EmrB/QacA subfamily drug resistance transporter